MHDPVIHSLFYPRGVAVIGSTGTGKMGYELIRQVLRGGYTNVYAVNPKAQGVFDVPGFTAVEAIPTPIDLAVVASPARTVPAVLEDCGRAGVRAAVIITSGFSEVGNTEGEEALMTVARRYGMRIVGPNCAGIVNTTAHLFASLETHPPAGPTAFISQSGALGGMVLSWAEEQGLGISKFVSYGNRADLDEIELLPYLAEDPDTKVVALYIESVRDGPAFMQAVETLTRHKPLVVIKGGRSRAGRRATLSHTGSMAGEDAVYDAVLRQCGAIRVETVEEMFDLCKGFANLPPVEPRGETLRLAIVTNSGGPGVLATDRAEQEGLDVAEPSPTLLAQLRDRLPPYAATRNPVDLTVQGTGEEYRDVLTAMLHDEYDAALAIDISPPYLDALPLARGVVEAAQATGKPIVANFMVGRIVAEGVAHLRAHGIPNYTTGERAVTVLARMAAHTRQQAARRTAPPPSPPPAPHPRPPLPRPPILEPEAMAWLGANKLPTLPFPLVHSVAEAVDACHILGYPVVMKVVSPEIIHKSDVGGVIVGVENDHAAQEAFTRLTHIAQGRDFRGVIIYPQIREATEVILGLTRDPVFGPVILFGLGGIYTELWRDIAMRVAPLSLPEAQTMIREIRAYPLLTGMRGHPPRDLDTLAHTLVKFSHLPLHYPALREVDLNPVFLLEKGLVIGDVRVILK